jgi:hypothetical protein
MVETWRVLIRKQVRIPKYSVLTAKKICFTARINNNNNNNNNNNKDIPVLSLTEHHAMKAYWGSGGRSPWYPLDRRLGGPYSRSGHGGEEKNSQPPPGIEP